MSERILEAKRAKAGRGCKHRTPDDNLLMTLRHCGRGLTSLPPIFTLVQRLPTPPPPPTTFFCSSSCRRKVFKLKNFGAAWQRNSSPGQRPDMCVCVCECAGAQNQRQLSSCTRLLLFNCHALISLYLHKAKRCEARRGDATERDAARLCAHTSAITRPEKGAGYNEGDWAVPGGVALMRLAQDKGNISKTFRPFCCA